MNFDITCMATLRPELLKKTLTSFNTYLFKERVLDARLLINIDYTGTEDNDKANKRDEIFALLATMPYKSIKVNLGLKPNFAHAFHWCMRRTSTQYIFNLEEDWELLYDVDFNKMIQIMDMNCELAHLRLSAFRSETDTIKCWQNFAHHNGEFFEYQDGVKQIDGWSGHPSFNRRTFMIAACDMMDKDANPEKQIKGRIMEGLIKFYRFGIFHEQNREAAIRDIGREWMVKHGWRKKGNKSHFTEWERDNHV